MSLNPSVMGNGPDVVLIHGWGTNAGIWRETAAALAARFRVHAPDLPGHGAAPAHPRDGLQEWVNLIAGSMPRACHVVGWSLGALAAMAWARAVPQQVRRLALLAATPSFTCRDGWAHGMSTGALETFARDLRHDAGRALRRFFALQALGDTHARTVASALRCHAPPDGASCMNGLSAGLRILAETDLREMLAGISQQTLVVHGERDRLIPPVAGQFVGSSIPGARFELVRGAAHAPFLSRPHEIGELLTAFLHG